MDFKINATTALAVDADPFTWQVQVGSRRYPDFPAQGVAESYYRLMQSVGVSGNLEDTTLTPKAYIEEKGGILGINFEKLGDQAAFSGINTQGQVMTLTLNNAWDATADANARRVFCYQVYDSILNIRGVAGGADIVD